MSTRDVLSLFFALSIVSGCDLRMEGENVLQKKSSRAVEEILLKKKYKNQLPSNIEFGWLPVSSPACIQHRPVIPQSQCINIVAIVSSEEEGRNFSHIVEQQLNTETSNAELKDKYVSVTFGSWKQGMPTNITPYGISNGFLVQGERIFQVK